MAEMDQCGVEIRHMGNDDLFVGEIRLRHSGSSVACTWDCSLQCVADMRRDEFVHSSDELKTRQVTHLIECLCLADVDAFGKKVGFDNFPTR